MSKYFDALSRLKRGRNQTSNLALRLAKEDETAVETPPEEQAAGPGIPFPELQLASRQASYAAVLDLLRATSKTSAIPAVVIAGVSGAEPVHDVARGIDIQARRLGVVLKRGRLDLATGARVLRLSSRRPLQESSSPGQWDSAESLRLSGSNEPGALADWLRKAAGDSDLLLIEAPSIDSSVEAALLGTACGGLVLVAEALVTRRAALQDCIERVHLAGCEILGIVLVGTKRWLPRWIGSVVGLLRRP